MIRDTISRLVEEINLSSSESEQTMNEIMSGKATGSQIAAFLTAMRMKGETIEELTAFASVMRQFCYRIYPKVQGTLVDTCGTGGDTIKTFNISTAAALIAAGAGVTVAKHGNRSVTSQCGSADILEAWGFNLMMEPDLVRKSIEEIGIGFMFAPKFHPAMKYAADPRREIGIRTIFNLLGPVTNPAGANVQLLGVFNEKFTEPLAHVLKNLGVTKAMVVNGLDGLDEISTIGKTKISSLLQNEVSTRYVTPHDLGLQQIDKSLLQISSPDESIKRTFAILYRKHDSPHYDIVLVNAAAAIFLGDKADNIVEGIEIARDSLESGSAYKKLQSLIRFSGGNLSSLEELENNEGFS